MKRYSLIHKTLMHFMWCTVVIFLLMTPLFYLLTKHFYAEDLMDVIYAVESGRGVPAIDLERDIMAGMTIQFLLTFAVMSVALFVTVRLITGKIWRPFDDTLRKIEWFSVAQGEIPEFTATGIIEFDRLNGSMSRLMRRNMDVYRIQKEFAENASHELQTPLAITRGKLDLLMQEEMSERQYQIISELYQLNMRMGHLNRNLLLLAKIENAQYESLEKISPVQFAERLLPSYNLLKGGCSVSLSGGSSRATRVMANPILLECLLNNLVVNAIRNTTSGDIRIGISDAGYGVRLTVSNPAEDGPLDREEMFRRFHPGASAKAGNGLGLSIVKAICDFHRWSVEYTFRQDRHIFTVSMSDRVK